VLGVALVAVEVEVDAAAPPAAGVAGWLANPIFRSKDGVLLPQPWLELPDDEPAAVVGELVPDSCFVELLSATLATPSISRRRDISLATSGWDLVQPVSSIDVPAGAPVLVGAAVPAVGSELTAVPFKVASEVFLGTTCEICASVACQSKRVVAS
jgi:hypothetical protein